MKTLSSAAIAAMTDGTAIAVGAVKIGAGPSAFGPIATASLAAGGSGYAAGGTGTITGGSGDATYTVLTVDGGGAVLTFSFTPGTNYKVANARATATVTGAGSGFTVNIDAIAPPVPPLSGTTFNLSWWQGTYEQTVNDQARMGIAFIDAAGSLISSITWAAMIDTPSDPTNTTGNWTQRTLSASIPSGAFGWRIYQEMQRRTGSSNDGYIDDIAADIDGTPVSIVNPDADSGNTAGWVVEAGTLAAATAGAGAFPGAHSGSHYFYGGNSGLSRAYTPPYSDTAAVRLWGGYGTIQLDSEDYLGIGDRGLVTLAGAAVGDAEQNVTLTLSGIEPAVLALLDAESLQRAPCKIWLLTFDGSGTQMLDAHVYAAGRLDKVTVDEEIGGTATIVAQVETAARGLGRSGQRMRTDADQRLINPADGAFKAVSFAGQKTLYWGGQRPSSASAAWLGGF